MNPPLAPRPAVTRSRNPGTQPEGDDAPERETSGSEPSESGLQGSNPSGAGSDVRVFINCPYDPSYWQFFAAITFTAFCCKVQPVCALTDHQGPASRLDNIKKQIVASAFSIHELSSPYSFQRNLTVAMGPKQPRLNMAFELGLIFGASFWGSPNQRAHQTLLLAWSVDRFRRELSDLHSHDPEIHHGKIKILIQKVYNFLKRVNAGSNSGPYSGPADILRNFNKFKDETPDIARKLGWLPAEFNIIDAHDDYITAMKERVSAEP